MRQTETNKTIGSRTNQKLIATFVGLFVVCAFCNLLVPQTMSQPTSLAAVGLSKNATEVEYEVKAAFIYNFIKFTEWPTEKQESQDSSHQMTIGILGDNPFGSTFNPIIGKEAHGQKIALVEIPGFHEFYSKYQNKDKAFAAYLTQYQEMIEACDVLFICESEKDHIDELLSYLSGKMILTISDLSGFAKKGGIIGFVKDNNKVRFEINLEAARKEGIKIRAQLLKLAKELY